MRQTWALVHKELREDLWFLVSGLTLFIAFPLVDAYLNLRARHIYGFYTKTPSGLIMALGAPLAVLLAVGITCRDLDDRLMQFWRSRPIGLVRWLMTKYAAGLGILGLICGLSMAIQIATEIPANYRRYGDVIGVIACLGPTLMLVYSLAFLTGCLSRVSVPAAILSTIATLIVLFLPMVIPPLSWLSAYNMIAENGLDTYVVTGPFNDWHWSILWSYPWAWLVKAGNIRIPGTRQWIRLTPQFVAFSRTMLVGSATALGLAWLTLRRDWRLQLNLKSMCWTLAGVFIVFLATASSQFGANLRVFAQSSIINGEGCVESIAMEGMRGVVMTKEAAKPTEPRDQFKYQYALQTVDLTTSAPILGPKLVVGASSRFRSLDNALIALPGSAGCYGFVFQNIVRERARTETGGTLYEEADGGRRVPATQEVLKTLEFRIASIQPGAVPKVLGRLDLMDLFPEARHPNVSISVLAYCANGRLFIGRLTSGLFEIDASDPTHPIGRRMELQYKDALKSILLWTHQDLTRSLLLPPVSGLSPRQRLEFALAMWDAKFRDGLALHDDLLVKIGASYGDLNVYRLVELDESHARFELLGERRGLPLERLLKGNWFKDIIVKDGVVYAIQQAFGSVLTVYDIRNPSRPKRVGHFIEPAQPLGAIAVLPDGGVLAAGTRLSLLAPPNLN